MASASAWQVSALRHSLSSSSNINSFAGLPRLSNLAMPPLTTLHYSTIASVRRRGNLDRAASSSSAKRKIKKKESRDPLGDEDLDEDAFEALFKNLEEDLKNDESIDDIDDISEEDFIKLEKEIEEALAQDEDLSDLLNSLNDSDDDEGGDAVGEIEEQEESYGNEVEEEKVHEEPKLQLRTWQLRRLASALKKGRRKTSIKTLATEIDLDRTIVLELLRNPPPSLLMMSSALPDYLDQSFSTPQTESEPEVSLASEPSTTVPSSPEDTSHSGKTPIHVLRSGWTARKRLKKVHVETLERVYRRSKRPTNSLVSSIVQVTNLPRKRIVKWFEEKRAEEGVPDQHRDRTYRRKTSETHPAFSNLSDDSSIEPT